MSLVMPTVRVLLGMLRAVPMLRVLLVVLWLMVLPLMPMVMVVQVMLRFTVSLVMMMVRVLQVVVLVPVRVWVVFGLCLGVGRRYSWLGACWAATLAGKPASPAGASDDADGEGAAGAAPGDVVDEGGVLCAPAVGVAGDADVVIAASDDLVDGGSLALLWWRGCCW